MTRQPRGIRAENRERIETEILRLGREQLASVGPAGLSVRAVARDLGMASSAVYRYVASRDELLTRLIVESYDALGDAAQEAHDAVDAADLRGRWFAVGRAVRAWGIAHPHDWALLYGSPVPGYAAPTDRTTDPGTRVTDLLAGLLRDAVSTGREAPEDRRPPASPALLALASHLLGALGPGEEDVSPALFATGIVAWTLVVGSVSSEVFEQLGELGPSAYAVLHDHALALGAHALLR
ncbi:MAG: TetR/AcrR family transcriptional regulator [Dermatophilaceae bacterium]